MSRMERVTERIQDRWWHLEQKEDTEHRKNNDKIVTEVVESVLKGTLLEPVKASFRSGLEYEVEQHPDSELAKKLSDLGYVPMRHRGTEVITNKFIILLQTALQTTTKKIWTDIHSPLKAFLEAIDRCETTAQMEDVISDFLTALE